MSNMQRVKTELARGADMRGDPIHHDTEVYSEPRVGGGWFAKCLVCSWRGRIYESRGAARDDGDGHVIAMMHADDRER